MLSFTELRLNESHGGKVVYLLGRQATLPRAVLPTITHCKHRHSPSLPHCIRTDPNDILDPRLSILPFRTINGFLSIHNQHAQRATQLRTHVRDSTMFSVQEIAKSVPHITNTDIIINPWLVIPHKDVSQRRLRV